MTKPSIAIIGAGKVGCALGLLLHDRGYKIAAVASRRIESARELADRTGATARVRPEEAAGEADLVFITTPDREIPHISEIIAERGGFRAGQIVAHTSGAHPSDELIGVKEAGAFPVSIHPLQSFADVTTAMENLPGSYFALEGDSRAMPVAERIVADLEGRAFNINARDKALYHAAACIASNYLVSLMHFSTGLYNQFGLSREEAFEALFPLIQGTINNIAKVGPVQALTGPVSRGDVPTIAGHLPALAAVGREEEQLYRLLGRYTARVAREKGSIDDQQAYRINQTLKGDKIDGTGNYSLLQESQKGWKTHYHADRV
ncbi:ketopantoate reductase PanG [Desulfocucumis palustris]|uniref:Ketopantoate reductase PanG n=1 Tax=Desulfocucumis palustris TaxID=1898651 RepID=A0A2L2X8Z0_9FIRM|nr:DUF2520 domain-containing protein [Desulfocucumis palustris]GBF32053.1 ketopantoate reductase PanG [Desulfocucumis palustris]